MLIRGDVQFETIDANSVVAVDVQYIMFVAVRQ